MRDFALLLALLIGVSYAENLLGLKSFVHRDFGLFTYPLAQFLQEAVWRGEFPLWNHYNNLGIPFFAQWNTQVLYPGAWFYVLLPLPWSLNVYSLLHLFLAGSGMYLLAREWTGHPLGAALAGSAYVFNGLVLNALMWSNNIAALGWMPWVVLCAARAAGGGRRRLLLAAAVAALQMLSGAPEVILLTWAVLLPLACLLPSNRGVAWFRVLARLALIAVLVALLCAVQLLPFFELLLHSSRNQLVAQGDWAIGPAGLANLAVPLFQVYRSPSGLFFQDGQYWTAAYYPGLAILLLALWAAVRLRSTPVLALAVAALLGCLLAMGENGPFAVLFSGRLPLLAWLRFPVKFLVLVSFCLPLLAAHAVAGLAVRPVRGPHGSGRQLAALAALGAALCLLIAGWAALYPIHARDTAWSALSAGTAAAGMLALLAALRYYLHAPAAGRKRAAGLLVLLLVWLFNRVELGWQNPVVDPARLAAVPEARGDTPLPRTLQEGRVLLALDTLRGAYLEREAQPAAGFNAARLGLQSDTNLLERVPKVDGFFALYLAAERDVHFRLYRDAQAEQPRLADFVGAVLVAEGAHPVQWRARPGAMPLLYGGQRPEVVAREAVLERLLDPGFDPRRSVLVAPEAAAAVAGLGAAQVTISEPRVAHDRISAQVDASQRAVVTLAQVDYPAWEARLDGRPHEIIRVNHAFQGVVVPAGRHRLEFVYVDGTFRTGLAISLATLLLLAAAWAAAGAARRSRSR